MGQSEKAPKQNYRYYDHSRYLDAWFDALNLNNVTLVLHDWGSALGFYWAYRNSERVKAIAYMEAIVRPRQWEDFPNGRDALFKALRSEQGEEMVLNNNFFIETVLPKSILRPMSDDEMDAYRAPFKTSESRLPTLIFPRELPIAGNPEDIVATIDNYGQWLAQSNALPKLLIVAEPGAVLTGNDLAFCRTWPNQKEALVKGIHYIQEDSPAEIGTAVREFVQAL